jgi:hypothetical protein
MVVGMTELNRMKLGVMIADWDHDAARRSLLPGNWAGGSSFATLSSIACAAGRVNQTATFQAGE